MDKAEPYPTSQVGPRLRSLRFLLVFSALISAALRLCGEEHSRTDGYPFSSARTAWVAELACAMAAMDACASIWDLVRLAASAATSVSRMRDSADEKLVISDCDRSMA